MNEVLAGDKSLKFEIQIDMTSAALLAGAIFIAFAGALIVYKNA